MWPWRLVTQLHAGNEMFKAVIFDVDGTLLDSVDQHAMAWQLAFRRYGFEVPFSDIRYQIGKGGDKVLGMFLSTKEQEEVGEKITDYRSALFKKEFLPTCKPFPRFLACLRH